MTVAKGPRDHSSFYMAVSRRGANFTMLGRPFGMLPKQRHSDLGKVVASLVF